MKVKDVIERYKFHNISEYWFEFDDSMFNAGNRDLYDNPRLLNKEASGYKLIERCKGKLELHVFINDDWCSKCEENE